MPNRSARSEAYMAKLRDPRWQKKRLKILERDEWSCRICFDGEETLHVHHRRYIKGREPWDIPDSSLVTLCATCHESETELLRDELSVLEEVVRTLFFAHDINELAIGLHDASFGFQVPLRPDTATVLAGTLRNPELWTKACDAYYERLRAKQRDTSTT